MKALNYDPTVGSDSSEKRRYKLRKRHQPPKITVHHTQEEHKSKKTKVKPKSPDLPPVGKKRVSDAQLLECLRAR